MSYGPSYNLAYGTRIDADADYLPGTSTPGASAGRPDIEHHPELALDVKLGRGGLTGLYDQIEASWWVIASQMIEMSEAVADMAPLVELTPLPNETPGERAWNDALWRLVDEGRLEVMEGDGVSPGLPALLWWAARSVSFGASLFWGEFVTGRGLFAKDERIRLTPLRLSGVGQVEQYRAGGIAWAQWQHGNWTEDAGPHVLPGARLVHMAYRSDRGMPFGRGALRPIVPLFQAWQRAFITGGLDSKRRRGVLFMEEPALETPDGSSPADRAVRESMRRVGRNFEAGQSYVIHPNGTKMGVQYPSGTPPNLLADMQAYEDAAAKMFARQLRNIGNAAHGSQAAAESMSDEQADIDGARHSALVRRAWARFAEFVARSTGYVGRVRTMALSETDRRVSVVDITTSLDALQRYGGMTPADLEVAREHLPLASAEQAEESLPKEQAEEPTQALMVGQLQAVQAIAASLTPADPSVAPTAPEAALEMLKAASVPADAARRIINAQLAAGGKMPLQAAAPAGDVDPLDTSASLARPGAPDPADPTGAMVRPRLVLVVGPPCAGKSSALRELSLSGRPVTALSADELIYDLSAEAVIDGDAVTPSGAQSFNWTARVSRRAHDMLAALVREALTRGDETVVVDAPLTSPAVRERYRTLASEFGYDAVCMHVTAARDVLHARNAARPESRQLSPSALDAIVRLFVPPTPEEGFDLVTVRDTTTGDVRLSRAGDGGCDHDEGCGCDDGAPLGRGSVYQIVGRDGAAVQHYREPLELTVRGHSVPVDTYGAWSSIRDDDAIVDAELRDEVEALIDELREEGFRALEREGSLSALADVERTFRDRLRDIIESLFDRNRERAMTERTAQAGAQTNTPVRGPGVTRERLQRLMIPREQRLREMAPRLAERIIARAIGELADHWVVSGTRTGFGGKKTETFTTELRTASRTAGRTAIAEPPAPGMVITAMVRVSTKVAGRVCAQCEREDGRTFLLPEQLEELDAYTDLPDPRCKSTKGGVRPSWCECDWIPIWGYREDDAPAPSALNPPGAA